jgi:hypothetical protein
MKNRSLIPALCTLLVTSTALASSSHHESSKSYLNLLPQPKANKILATIPKKVILKSPEPLSKVKETSVLLEWAPSEGAETYHVQIAKDPAFKWILQEDHFVTATQFQATNLPKGQIFWRVAASKPKNMPAHWKSSFSASSFEVIE